MHYSKEYSKLNDWEYTTIRRYGKGRKVGYIVPEYVEGTFSHYVEIKAIFRRIFNEIPLKLLLKDTDCKTRDAAFDLLQAFYPKVIDKKEEKLYIYHLVKVQVVNEKSPRSYLLTIDTLQNLTHSLYKEHKTDAKGFNAQMLLINEYGGLFKVEGEKNGKEY